MEAQRIIFERIRNPIGCPQLQKLVKRKKRILMVTDDNTRQTPLKIILPFLLKELRGAGIKNNQIRILVASGTHRRMSRKELLNKFGKTTVSSFRIYQHSWNKKDALVRIDSAVNGKKIHINRLAKKSDFIIGVGSIVPHATTGFSGGGKIILPGICGRDTVEDMHWKALDFQIKDILGVYDNPMRRMVDSVARKVGLRFIVNAILNQAEEFVDIVAGDPIKAHRKGVEVSRQIFGLKASPADIVVADASPFDIDLRQAIKAVAASSIVVKKGGLIVLKARCPECVSPQFPEFERYGFIDPDGLKKKVEEGRVKEKVAAYTLIAIGRIMKDKAKVILVSKGVSRSVAEKLGFLWASSLKEALRQARQLVRKKPSIVFLKRACEILPLMN